MDSQFSIVRFVIEFIGDIWSDIFAMPDTDAAIEYWSTQPSLRMDILGMLVAITTGLVRIASVPFVVLIVFWPSIQWVWMTVFSGIWLIRALSDFLSDGKFPLFPRYK